MRFIACDSGSAWEKSIIHAELIVLLLCISYFVFVANYDSPAALFWDENYHIASAQKYLDGVMYMEPHPPLGKLLIALGEKITEPNGYIAPEEFNSFRISDCIKSVPQGFSFAGFRLFPVIFAVLNVLLIYMILFVLSKNPLFSFLFSFSYLFNNAVVVHFRGAMLDGIQLFFILGVVLFWLFQAERREHIRWHSYISGGIIAGLAMAVKLNSAIILPLFVLIYWYEVKDVFFHSLKSKKYSLLWQIFLKGLGRASLALGSIAFVFFLVFFIHTSLGKSIGGNTYNASSEYIEIIKKGGVGELKNFPVMMRDNWEYMSHYHEGVPKSDDNGSYPLEWILMNKCINYRWESDGTYVRYLYLVGNPLVWYAAIAGVLLSLSLVLTHFIFAGVIEDKRLFHYISCFLALYCAYMWAMSQIGRVMYMYHYFIPLHFSLVLFFLVFLYIFQSGLRGGSLRIYSCLFVLLFMLGKTFIFYGPLTYYKPVSSQQFQERVWSEHWGLRDVK